MLKGLLEFNPEERASVKACLKNPMFDSFRSLSLEKNAPRQVYLPLDDELTVDYDEVQDLKSVD